MTTLTVNIIHHLPRFERLPVLENELKQQGINEYSLWETVHAPTVIESINLSHKQIVSYAKALKLPEVLIMEDDIKFTDKEAFNYYLNQKPVDYDLYLGGIFLGQIAQDNTVKEFTGMTCCIVNQKFYDTFLNASATLHLDHSLANKGKYIVCNPFICTQHAGYSDNAKSYQNYDLLFENRKLYSSVK